MIEVGLVALLNADPDISALVATRIYPVLLPPNAPASGFPALTYQVAGGVSEPTFETSGPIKLRMQFDCWGKNYSDAAMLRKTLVQVLNGYTGILSDGTELNDSIFIQPIDFYEQDTLLYRCAVEFYFLFNFPRT
jgi:hypothetical protein